MRNDVTGLAAEHIGYENGVLGGLLAALAILCSQGDSVLIHNPAYVGYTMSLMNSGYNIVQSQLVQDENGICRITLQYHTQ